MLQLISTLSTMEAENMALTDAAKVVISLKNLVNDMGLKQGLVKVKCDSQSVMSCKESSLLCKEETH